MKKLIKLGLFMIALSLILMQKETIITFIKETLNPKNITVELMIVRYYKTIIFIFQTPHYGINILLFQF